MADIRDIDDWVDQAAALPIKSFYPTAVARATGLPLTVAFNRLLWLAEDKRISLHYEIRCPSYECVRTIRKLEEIPGEPFSIRCNTCGDEIEVDREVVFPVFDFDPEYKARILDKKKIQKGSSLLRNKPVLMS